MGFIIEIGILILTGAALAISGGFSTNAAIRVTQISGWEENSFLENAHRYLTGAAIATWISVALMIVLIILWFMFADGIGAGFVIYGFLFLTLGLTVLVGVLSAIAANDISRSKVPDNNLSYRQSVIAASIALGVVGLLIILFIAKVIINHKAEKEKEEKKDKQQSSILSLLSGGGGGNGGYFDNTSSKLGSLGKYFTSKFGSIGEEAESLAPEAEEAAMFA